MAINAPAGVPDLLPDTLENLLQLEAAARQTFSRFGYRQIETPIFEQLEVFVRGIGDATDVVGKEMYHVYSQQSVKNIAEKIALKSDQQLALRPENTAGIARAAVQHNLIPPGAAPVKLWYSGPMFRHERQQKGRYRQFHQIGAEFLGATEPGADAEVIIMLMDFFRACGIPANAMRLYVNSMGDDNCRPAYRQSIKDYILEHQDQLCDECKRRATTNPLRAFDCKNPQCAEVMAAAPSITSSLCPDCKQHYTMVQELLESSGLEYEENPRLVRGLDYYTRTVFEVQVDSGLGSQNAIGGGGRYDGLLQQFGGKPTPGLGFAVGLERILLVLEELGVKKDQVIPPLIFVIVAGEQDEPAKAGFAIAQKLRQAGFRVEADYQARSMKSQMKLADKLDATLAIIVGEEELAQGQVKLRDMQNSEEENVNFEDLIDTVRQKLSETTMGATTK